MHVQDSLTLVKAIYDPHFNRTRTADRKERFRVISVEYKDRYIFVSSKDFERLRKRGQTTLSSMVIEVYLDKDGRVYLCEDVMAELPKMDSKTVDTRPVIDYYKYWETDAIKADLDTQRNNFAVLCCNIQGDFNIGAVIRNANAFLAQEVIIFGKRKYDRRGTVGTHNYTHFKHVSEADKIPSDRPIVAIDNVPGAKSIVDYVWPSEAFIMAFGEEQQGLPESILSIAKDVVYIPQQGSTRSLNVGCASAIAMYDFINKQTQRMLCGKETDNVRATFCP